MKIGDRVIIKKYSTNGVTLPRYGEVRRITNIDGNNIYIGSLKFKEDNLILYDNIIGSRINFGKYNGQVQYSNGFYVNFGCSQYDTCKELGLDPDFVKLFPPCPTAYFPETENYYEFINKVEKFNNLKQMKNETKLQREETSVRGGEITEGHRICCRQYKTTIRRGHLDNKTWNLRSGERIKRNQEYLPF